MKTFLITLTFIWTGLLNAQSQITKKDFEAILTETLKKSRNAVSNATNEWRYDNSNEDYFTSNVITLNAARSYRKDYCKEIRWSFYENQKFVLQNILECTEPPTMLKPTKKDYIEISCIEKKGVLYLKLKNFAGLCDKFKVLEFRKNEPLAFGESEFDYTVKLLRIHK